MARAIVRYSCNNTAGKYQAERARAAIRATLEGAGFLRVGTQQRGTASWELQGASTATIGAALIEVFATVQGLAPGILDHVWVYCDE
jgi:hypothetical protein